MRRSLRTVTSIRQSHKEEGWRHHGQHCEPPEEGKDWRSPETSRACLHALDEGMVSLTSLVLRSFSNLGQQSWPHQGGESSLAERRNHEARQYWVERAQLWGSCLNRSRLPFSLSGEATVLWWVQAGVGEFFRSFLRLSLLIPCFRMSMLMRWRQWARKLSARSRR